MTARPMTSRWSIRRLWLLIPVLVLATYVPTFDAEPSLDDYGTVLNNPVVQDGFSLSLLMTTNIFGDRPGYRHVQNFRPLTTLSYRLGPRSNVPYQRGLNLAIHILCCFLVAWLALRMGAPPIGAWIGSLWFAVHPVHVDAVVPLNNRSDLLCCALLLGAVFIWWGAKSARQMLFAVFLGFLAALAKEQGIIAPILFLLIEFARHRSLRTGEAGQSHRPVAAPAWGWVLISFAFLCVAFVLRNYALGGVLAGTVPPSDNPLVTETGAGRWLSPGLLVVEAVRLMAVPAALSADYTANAVLLATTWLDPTAWFGWAMLFTGAIGFLGALWTGRQRVVTLLGGALLSYGVVSNTALLSTILFSERSLYIPSAFLAVAIAVAGGTVKDVGRTAKRVILISTSLLLMMFAARSYQRAGDYENAETLARTSLEATPGSARMWSVLGLALQTKGQSAAAERAYLRAKQLDPGCSSAYQGLGSLFWERGDFPSAATYFSQAVRASGGGDLYSAVFGASAHLRSGRPDLAIGLSEIALRLDSDNYRAWTNLARGWYERGDLDRGRTLMERTVLRFPREPMVLWYTMLFRISGQDLSGARSLWERGVRIQNDPRGAKKWVELGEQFGWTTPGTEN